MLKWKLKRKTLLLLYPHFSVIILICEKRSAATGRGTESRKAQAMI